MSAHRISAEVEVWDEQAKAWTPAGAAGIYAFLTYESAMGSAEFIFETLNNDESSEREQIAWQIIDSGAMPIPLAQGDPVYDVHSLDRQMDIENWLFETGMSEWYHQPQTAAQMAERYWQEVAKHGRVRE